METMPYLKKLVILPALLSLFACAEEASDTRVVLGRGDTIFTDNAITYEKPMLVQVSDSNGVPQAGVSVDITLRPIEFYKGDFTFTNDTDGDAMPDLWERITSATCNPEDVNENGRDDGGEDLNGNGTLDPAIPTIAQHPSATPTVGAGTATLVTDGNGQGYFVLSYPRSYAHWVRVEVTATANDGLPENKGIDTFGLPIAIDDINDPLNDPPGGTEGPYGNSGLCTDTL